MAYMDEQRKSVSGMTDEMRERVFAPITVDELAAIPSPPGVNDSTRCRACLSHFGWCPVCGRTDGILNIGTTNYMVCRVHKKVTCLGNIITPWKGVDDKGALIREDETDWRRNYILMHDYEEADFSDWSLVFDALKRAGLDGEVPRGCNDNLESARRDTREFEWLVAQAGFCEPPVKHVNAVGLEHDFFEDLGPAIEVPLTREECRRLDAEQKEHSRKVEQQGVVEEYACHTLDIPVTACLLRFGTAKRNSRRTHR
jgi:hypothetical protein